MIDQFQSEVGYLRDQNSSLFENLMCHNIQTSTNLLEPSEPKFFPKFINRNTNNLIISDNTYKKILQSDISYDTGIHSNRSTTIIDLGQTVKQYSSGAKCQSLIFHAGHNSINNGVSGVATASQFCETVAKAIKKLKPHRVLLFEIPQVEIGHYGRESNNIEIEEFNKQLGNIALELNGTFKWTKVEVLKCNIKTSEISNNDVHLNLAGVQKIIRRIRNFYQKQNITVSQNNIALRQIQRFYSILWLCDFMFFCQQK